VLTPDTERPMRPDGERPKFLGRRACTFGEPLTQSVGDVFSLKIAIFSFRKCFFPPLSLGSNECSTMSRKTKAEHNPSVLAHGPNKRAHLMLLSPPVAAHYAFNIPLCHHTQYKSPQLGNKAREAQKDHPESEVMCYATCF